jgi:hypothetical protein
MVDDYHGYLSVVLGMIKIKSHELTQQVQRHGIGVFFIAPLFSWQFAVAEGNPHK